jgi:hypothetical protein
MVRRAAEVIAEGDPSAVVDFAIDLNRKVFQLNKELEEAKEYLRQEARKKDKRAAEVELEGLSGTISVVFPGLTLKVKKGADLKNLEVNLSPEIFAKLFFRTIEIKPAHAADDFVEILGSLSPADQERVNRFIEAVDQTAKVFVPR